MTPQFNGSTDMSNLVVAPSPNEMWIAYAIAPAVTPVTFIGLVSLVGVTLPANVIAIGFCACYLVAGLIGMPIAFLLRRNNWLNVWTIHGAALTWGLLWSLFCTVAAVYIVAAIGGDVQSPSLTAGWFIALMVPPVVLAGTAFWILVKRPKLH